MVNHLTFIYIIVSSLWHMGKIENVFIIVKILNVKIFLKSLLKTLEASKKLETDLLVQKYNLGTYAHFLCNFLYDCSFCPIFRYFQKLELNDPFFLDCLQENTKIYYSNKFCTSLIMKNGLNTNLNKSRNSALDDFLTPVESIRCRKMDTFKGITGSTIYA